jgi:predicted transcriptional regulator
MPDSTSSHGSLTLGSSPPTSNLGVLGLTAQIVSAHVGNNKVSTAELPTLIQQVYLALNGSSAGSSSAQARPTVAAERPRPAVPISKSVFTEYIVCLEDGKKLKMLKRYLRARYGLTPDAYRAKWNLPADYPMTAPNYAARRSDFAKQIGLGKPAKKKS